MALQRVTFADHLEYMRPKIVKGQRSGWLQGEHMLLLAPTGVGKTELEGHLARFRGNSVMFITKTGDPILSDPLFSAWDRRKEWNPEGTDRVMLFPGGRKTSAETVANNRKVFGEALEYVNRVGRWTVYLDELHYMTDPTFGKQASIVKLLYHQGRSNNITLVAATQRPAWIPVIVYSSSTHIYMAKTNELADIRKLGSLAGIYSSQEVMGYMAELEDRHDFLYFNARERSTPVIVNTRR